ncbi:hypothetical protein MXB_1956, partial [Myxobolus squamalis]
GVSIIKPIVFGNIARAFTSPRSEDSRTHEWTLYVKSYYDEVFKLHESYSNPIRGIYPILHKELFEPPYEISETGWGEFELTLYHIIRLFPINAVTLKDDENLIVSELYDEIVINDPTATIYRALESSLDSPQFPLTQNIDCIYRETKIPETIDILKENCDLVASELAKGKNYLNRLKERIINLQTLLSKESSDGPETTNSSS